MCKNLNLKISTTAYRVLLIMKLLNRQGYNVDELNEIFASNKRIKKTLSKEVILKYLSTLRSAGYKISKPCLVNNYSYKLLQAPISIKLKNEALDALVILESYVSSLYQKRLVYTYNNFLHSISRYLCTEQINQLTFLRKKHENLTETLHKRYAQYSSLIQKFENFCIDDQRITVKYKFPRDDEENEVILEPKLIKYNRNEVFISGYNPIVGERQLINLSYVLEMKQLPIKSKHNNTLSPVIFNIKGRVAKGYRLYEDEKIIGTDSETGALKIAAYVDDKNILMQRLLKYGDYCEVLYPKSVRENIISILEEVVKNYEPME